LAGNSILGRRWRWPSFNSFNTLLVVAVSPSEAKIVATP
jgi:hypothetical protein